jgi:hypothetical protein
VFNMTTETMGFLEDTDVEATIQREGNRAYARLVDVLRKSGRVDIGGVTYPRVTNGGKELEFRLLQDLDGNGYPFQQATGDLEWDARVHVAKTDADDNFGIYVGADRVLWLGRYIENLQFETIAENTSLNLKEIKVSFEVRKPARSGYVNAYPVEGSAYMRN